MSKRKKRGRNPPPLELEWDAGRFTLGWKPVLVVAGLVAAYFWLRR